MQAGVIDRSTDDRPTRMRWPAFCFCCRRFYSMILRARWAGVMRCLRFGRKGIWQLGALYKYYGRAGGRVARASELLNTPPRRSAMFLSPSRCGGVQVHTCTMIHYSQALIVGERVQVYRHMFSTTILVPVGCTRVPVDETRSSSLLCSALLQYIR